MFASRWWACKSCKSGVWKDGNPDIEGIGSGRQGAGFTPRDLSRSHVGGGALDEEAVGVGCLGLGEEVASNNMCGHIRGLIAPTRGEECHESAQHSVLEVWNMLL